jgi:glycosyltransferase involved in cell wall biosynthesis
MRLDASSRPHDNLTPSNVAIHPVSYILICHSYPPVLGGSEVEAQRVSDELQKRGYRPRIVCAGGAPMPPLGEWVDPFGLRVRIYGGGRSTRWRDLVYALGVAWTLFKERHDYEVVYFLMSGLHLATGLPVARLLGKPIVMKFSCSSLVVGMRNSFLGRLELSFLRRWASRILVLNPGMVEEALEVGFDRARIGWMPNPVDTDHFRPCSPEERVRWREELHVGADTPLAVFVGRLDPQKELPWLIGAFAQVVLEIPDAVLVLVGDGSLRAQLGELVTSLNLDRNVRFTGRLNTAGVLKWLQAGDLITLISAIEGLPCSLIEAMSAGLPAVVSDIPAHTQLVDTEVNGVVTKLGDQGSIAHGLVRLLNDPPARKRMGAAARRRMVEQFSTPKVVDCYETLFAECTAAEGYRA